MARKTRVAIQNVAYCGGCEVALSDLGQDLLDLLDRSIELVYAPLFMSAKSYQDVDLVLITGAVRSEEDLKLVQEARQKARYLAAFGSCSALGGVPGLANLVGGRGLLDAVYGETHSIGAQGGPPQSNDRLPRLLETVAGLETHTKVDFILPGCPPPPPMIAEFMGRVLRKIH